MARLVAHPSSMINGRTCRVMAAGTLLLLGLASAVHAGELYTYLGNDYTRCNPGGPYCTGGPYALDVTFQTSLSGSALDDLNQVNIAADVTSFRFTDGSGLTITQSTLGVIDNFTISTNAAGDITAWLVGGYYDSSEVQMQTNYDSTYGFIPGLDFSETTADFLGNWGSTPGGSAYVPGTWTAVATVSTPEPPVWALIPLALALMWGTRRYRSSRCCAV
jgi:hypothetical protein